MSVAILYGAFRENAGTSVAGNNTVAAEGDSYDYNANSSRGVSAFAALGIEDTGADENEDFGGLMVSR
jgi:hypothetical protein